MEQQLQQLQQQLQLVQQQQQQLQQQQMQTTAQLLRLEILAARGHNHACFSGLLKRYEHVPNASGAALPAALAPIRTLAELNALDEQARTRCRCERCPSHVRPEPPEPLAPRRRR